MWVRLLRQPPENTPWPLPYEDAFDGYPLDATPFGFSDLHGTFSTHADPRNASNQVGPGRRCLVPEPAVCDHRRGGCTPTDAATAGGGLAHLHPRGPIVRHQPWRQHVVREGRALVRCCGCTCQPAVARWRRGHLIRWERGRNNYSVSVRVLIRSGSSLPTASQMVYVAAGAVARGERKLLREAGQTRRPARWTLQRRVNRLATCGQWWTPASCLDPTARRGPSSSSTSPANGCFRSARQL